MAARRCTGVVPAPGRSFNTDVNWTSTLTGRLGLAFDRWLVYGKGGVAWADDKFSTDLYTFPGTVEVTDTRIGWTAGAGVEYAFAPALVGEARVQLHGLRQQGRVVRARERPPTSISRSIR